LIFEFELVIVRIQMVDIGYSN